MSGWHKQIITSATVTMLRWVSRAGVVLALHTPPSISAHHPAFLVLFVFSPTTALKERITQKSLEANEANH